MGCRNWREEGLDARQKFLGRVQKYKESWGMEGDREELEAGI